MAWTVDEHAEHVAQLLALDWHPETVGLDEALGRMTAAEVATPVDLPLFRNSQMDGFAVRVADLGMPLQVVEDIPAQAGTPRPLAAGTAARIMTGAPVPDGADAVIPVEDTSVEGLTLTVHRPRAVGEYVRERGSDLRAGDPLLPAGVRLASRHLAALAAAGLATVEVRSRVRVAIVTTGSELVAPGSDPAPGEVFDSNGTALDAAVRAAGGLVVSRTHVTDDPRALERHLRAVDADLVITSGGISMGEYEVVRETLEPFGARVGHVAMQPGGPQATAVFEGIPVVCFPGNPVSTQVSFEVFVAPILRDLVGLPAAVREQRPLDAAVRSVPGRRQFLRGTRTATGVTVSGPSSHLVAALAAADVLVVVPEEVTELAAGDLVETWAL